MPAGEEERLALLRRLTEAIGADAARTIMESLPPMQWDQLATKDDLKALEERLVNKFGGEFNKVYGEIGKLNGEFANVRGEIKDLRGSISLEISKQTRTLVFTMVGVRHNRLDFDTDHRHFLIPGGPAAGGRVG
ncbi:MAG: hypothetical protein F4Y27_10940 [Acidimicrobiaceae bacterium]|nr:hypothetical protein [Acidimicrobiaceae bacterium]MXW76297.1 hypothetical protein [Acidimicrobiaceae bacterium]MYA75179.1 hypothetical protein [Acidimicrobiaceae bacterium]MYC42982.1 hypothetical protein [Acidimicrobiaceae bacterium]MYD07524.1 hypothetical protein [Acidimicrobiaceae bacterium]